MPTSQSIRILAWARVYLGLILAALIVLTVRVAQLKISPDPRLAGAVGTSTSARPELTRRGSLKDRRGRIIAASVVGHRLFVDPPAVDELHTLSARLAELLGLDAASIDRKLAERPGSRYVVIAETLERWQTDAVRQAGLRGVGTEPRLVRSYPHGDLGRNLAGLVGFEHTGLAGLEHAFEQSLRQRHGRLRYLRDARRRAMWVSPDGYEPAAPGRDVALSIDLVIQEMAERHLADAVRERHAGGGRLVVLDCRSGELLAMADVLNPRPGWSEQTEDPGREIDPGLARNRCVGDPYEPGSTFKPFIWAAATGLGLARAEEILPTPASSGHVTSQGRRIRDSTYVANADWHTVLTHSLNSGMAIVAERMSAAQMQGAVSSYGFGRLSRCGLPGETRGLVTPPEKWSHYTQTSVAMGHEIGVTPVQMVRAFAVFARDGTLPPLRITRVEPGAPELHLAARVLPEALARFVRRALRDVVVEGSGHRAASERYQLFGKSGTAQLPRREGGGYHEHRYVSSFIAGAPFEEPRLVVLCVIDDPDRARGHFGGAIAAPVVRDVMEAALAYLGVEDG